MTPTVISIQGRATFSKVAERAALLVDISDTDPEKNLVSSNVVSTVNTLQSKIDALCPRLPNNDISPDAPVSFYSIATLSTSSEDEYDGESTKTGRKLFTARTTLDVHFRDFKKLSDMVVHLSTLPFVHLQGITWKLTDETKAKLGEEARLEALRNAIKRANAYAGVIGREKVTPVKIEDEQEYFMLGMAKQTEHMTSGAAVFGLGVGIDFEPQLIEVSATVNVEFHAE